MLDSEYESGETNLALIVNQIKKEIDIMPSIRKRQTGLYEARISFKGRYFSVYDRNLSDLKTKITRKFRELKKEYAEAKTLAYTKKDWVTLEYYYKEWLEKDKKPFLKEKTIELIENVFNNHILPKLGKTKLKDLDNTKIQNFLNKMPKTRTKEMISNYFKACVTQAHKERLIDYNPFDLVKFEKKIKSEKGAFSAEEQQTILEHLKTSDVRLYKIILLYLCTGCRLNELPTIELLEDKNFILVKGTKTENAFRYIQISEELRQYITESWDIVTNFPTDYIAKRFRKALSELNIKGSIHTLRHTFATNHYFLGTPAKQLQVWMGHSTINLTLDIYTNIPPTIDAKSEKIKILKLYNNLYYYN